MKTKYILFFILFAGYLSAGAQLRMTNGKISVGNRHSLDNGYLKMGNDGLLNGISFYDKNNGGSDFRIFRHNDFVYLSRGGDLDKSLRMDGEGKIAIGTNRNYLTHKVMFGAVLNVYSHDISSMLFKVESSNQDWQTLIHSNAVSEEAILYSGWVGDNPKFTVFGDGTILSNGIYAMSDITLKNNIKPITHSLDKVMQLRGVTFDYKRNTHTAEKIDDAVKDMQNKYEKANKIMPKLTMETFKQMEAEKARRRMGVIAQEVEKVIPEVVRTCPDGSKAVAYPEMIGLLIEAVKELKTEIEELKENTNNSISFRVSAGDPDTAGTTDSVTAQCILYQNTPNPFSQNTQIRYYIPESVAAARLCIYNLQGIQIKQITIKEHGEGSQWISASELPPAMYLYALIADGKEVDVKRMILTD